ncbi:hypothetical protein [Thermofilum sp.]
MEKDHSSRISGKLKVEVALWHAFGLSALCVFEDVFRRGVLEKKIKPLVE